jgi:hypothetical protein
MSEDNLEGMPNGQAPVSKTAASQKGVEGSTPSPSAAKKPKVEPTFYSIFTAQMELCVPRFRVLCTTPSPRSMETSCASFPRPRWSTMEEIVQIVWECEKRNVRLTYSRSRKQIEDGVMDMVEHGAVAQK